jgi:hypothetical protein
MLEEISAAVFSEKVRKIDSLSAARETFRSATRCGAG